MAKAFKSKRRNDEIIALFLILLGIPAIASTNIDCNGKSFHCVNSTHFMICVDLGGGTCSTIDDFVIQCPPTTTCHSTNHFECEFFRTTTPLPVKVSEVSYEPITTTSRPWEEISDTVRPSKHVSERERENYYNTIDVATEVSVTNDVKTVSLVVDIDQNRTKFNEPTTSNKFQTFNTTNNPNQINLMETTVATTLDNIFMNTSSVVTESEIYTTTRSTTADVEISKNKTDSNETITNFTTEVNTEYVPYTTISSSLKNESETYDNLSVTDFVSHDSFNNTSSKSIVITASDYDADNILNNVSTTTLATDTTAFTQENLQEITKFSSIDQIGIITYGTTTDNTKVFTSAADATKKYDHNNDKQNGNNLPEFKFTTEAVPESTFSQHFEDIPKALSENETITKYYEEDFTTAPANNYHQNFNEQNLGNTFGDVQYTTEVVPESTLSQQLVETQTALSENEAVTKFTEEVYTTSAIPIKKDYQNFGEIGDVVQHTSETVPEIPQKLEKKQKVLGANEAVTRNPEGVTAIAAGEHDRNLNELNFGNLGEMQYTTEAQPESTLSQLFEEKQDNLNTKKTNTNITIEVFTEAAYPTIQVDTNLGQNNEYFMNEVQYSATETVAETTLEQQFESNGAADTGQIFPSITSTANVRQHESTPTVTETSQQYESTAINLQTPTYVPQLHLTIPTSHIKDKHNISVDTPTNDKKRNSNNSESMQHEAILTTEPEITIGYGVIDENWKTEINAEQYFGGQNNYASTTDTSFNLPTTSTSSTLNTIVELKNNINTNQNSQPSDIETATSDNLSSSNQPTEASVTDSIRPVSQSTTESETLNGTRTSIRGEIEIISINPVTSKITNSFVLSQIELKLELAGTTENTSELNDQSQVINQQFSINESYSDNQNVIFNGDSPNFLDGSGNSTTVKDPSDLNTSLGNETKIEKEVERGQIVVIPVINELLDTNLLNTSIYRPAITKEITPTTNSDSNKIKISDNDGLITDQIQHTTLPFTSSTAKSANITINSINSEHFNSEGNNDSVNNTVKNAPTQKVIFDSALNINEIIEENKYMENVVNKSQTVDDSFKTITTNTSKTSGKQNIERFPDDIKIIATLKDSTSNILTISKENKTSNISEIEGKVSTLHSNDSVITSQLKNSVANTLSVSDKSVTGNTSDDSLSKSKLNSDYNASDINNVYTPTTKLPAYYSDSIKVDTNSFTNASTGSNTVSESVISNSNTYSNVTTMEPFNIESDSKVNKSTDKMGTVILDIPTNRTGSLIPLGPNPYSSRINATTILQVDLKLDSNLKVSNKSQIENDTSKIHVDVSPTVTLEKEKVLNESGSIITNENIHLATTENYLSTNIEKKTILYSGTENKTENTVSTNKTQHYSNNTVVSNPMNVMNISSTGALNHKETEENTKRSDVNVLDSKNISLTDLKTSNRSKNNQSTSEVPLLEATISTMLASSSYPVTPVAFTESIHPIVLDGRTEVPTITVADVPSSSIINKEQNIRPDNTANILNLILNSSATPTSTDTNLADSSLPTSENTNIQITTIPSILISNGEETFNSAYGNKQQVSNIQNTGNVFNLTTSKDNIEASTQQNTNDNHNQTKPQNGNKTNSNANKPSVKFSCLNKTRGRYSDDLDCRKFYLCFGRTQPIFGTCPNNTVFSETKKQCTNNLSQCIRRNEFLCTTAGRFSDYLQQNVYYICIQNKNKTNKQNNIFLRFKFQCQIGHYLNKETVKCEIKINKSDKPKSIEQDDVERNDESSVEVKSIEERKSKLKEKRKNKISEEDTKSKQADERKSKQKDDKKSKQKEDKKSKQNEDRKSKENEGEKSKQEVDKKLKENTDKQLKTDVRQKIRSEEEKNSKSKNSFECEEDGRFPDPEDCRRYFVCSRRRSSYRRRRKTCDSDELFDKDKKKCVDEESYECL